MTALPYISWLGHGTANLAPPGVFTGAKAAMFAIDGDGGAMQNLADTLLNPAGGGVVHYDVLAPVAAFSFMDIARCTSGTDIVGWLPGREAAIWIPLLETHPAHPLRDRLVLWAPYIFINYAIGMVIGREDWGWPKVLGEIAVGADAPAAPTYGVSTTYFPTFSAATEGVTGPLYTISGGQLPAAGQATWSSGLEAIEALTGAVLGGVAEVLVDALHLSLHAPSVALKQFREPSAPQTACYQAIANSPIAVTAFYGGGILQGPWELDIATCASHPIVQDILGRPPDPGSTKVPIKFAAWSEIDFEALPGSNIVVGGQPG